MLPIIFEVPDDQAPLSILRGCWEAIGRAFPTERGRAHAEPAPDLGAGIVRVVIEVPEREPVYLALLDCLTAIDIWCRQQRSYPSVYDGGLRYEREPIGLEIFASTIALFARGAGDCEDLSCDRTAELSLQGVAARPLLDLEQRTPQGDFYHVLVETPGGIEDPSAALMR